jgi:hypothetical protein
MSDTLIMALATAIHQEVHGTRFEACPDCVRAAGRVHRHLQGLGYRAGLPDELPGLCEHAEHIVYPQLLGR